MESASWQGNAGYVMLSSEPGALRVHMRPDAGRSKIAAVHGAHYLERYPRHFAAFEFKAIVARRGVGAADFVFTDAMRFRDGTRISGGDVEIDRAQEPLPAPDGGLYCLSNWEN